MNKIVFTKHSIVGKYSYYVSPVSSDTVAMCHQGLLRAFGVAPNTIEIRRKNPKKKGWVKLRVRRNTYDYSRLLFKYDDDNFAWVSFYGNGLPFFEGITNEFSNFVWVCGK